MSGRDVNWLEISDELEHHDATSCERRWIAIGWVAERETPAVHRVRREAPIRRQQGDRVWTPEEDALLRRTVDDQIDWRGVAELVTARSAGDCEERWDLIKS